MNKNYQQAIWTKSFISISITQFMVFLTFYALLTTLPIFVINNLGGSAAEGGLVVTVMLISAIVVRPFSAKILDHLGKKKGLIFSIIIFTVTSFLYIWIDNYVPLILLRLFHGLSFGLLSTATGAIAADVIPAARRGEGLGYFAMAMNLAVVAGPFIGLSLLQFVSFQTLFIVLSILMVGGVVCSIIVHVPAINVAGNEAKHKFTLNDLIEMKSLPIALISSIVSLAYASVLSYISVYSDSIGLASTASYFFLVFAIVMIASRPYFGRAFDAKGPNYVILPCLLIFAVGLVMLSFTNNAWMLLVRQVSLDWDMEPYCPVFKQWPFKLHPSTGAVTQQRHFLWCMIPALLLVPLFGEL